MTHISPTAYCVWSVLTFAMGGFLLGHLWRFDRFKCLKWSNSPYSGAFKRFMTYTYLLTVPLIAVYSVGNTYVKYKVGYITVLGQTFPKPYELWPAAYQRVVFPLIMVFAVGWSFEMITHLEELCFWIFLVNAGPQQPDWFRSRIFKIWMCGSVVALIYVPTVTAVYRHDPLSCEAHTFLAGSIGDIVLTVAFIPILWNFPTFLQKVKKEGVDFEIIVRLRKFHELNVARIIFRFLFCLPLFTLGVDGVRGHTHHVNESLFWTDVLVIVAGMGCTFSSVCTLLIFFPRSYEAEYHAYEASLARSVHTRSSLTRSRAQQTQVRRPSSLRHQVGDHIQMQNPESTQSCTSPTSTPRLPNKLISTPSTAALTRKATYLLTDSPVTSTHSLPREFGEPLNDLTNVGQSNALPTEVITEEMNYPYIPSVTQYQKSPEDVHGEGNDNDPWQDAKDNCINPSGDTYDEYGGFDSLPKMTYSQGVNFERPVSRPTPVDSRYGYARQNQPTGPRPLGVRNSRPLGLTAENLHAHNSWQSRINPLVHNFSSPIDVLTRSEEAHSRVSRAGWV